MAARDDTRKYQAYVGAFVVAGGLAMAALIFLWVTPSGMFTGTYMVEAEMPHVGNLSVGAPVRLAGIKVGKVRAISLEHGARDVLVTISVNDDINLPKDSTASVATSGLVGDQYLELRLGENKTMIPHLDEPPADYRIRGEGAFDIEKLTKTVGKATELIDEVKLLVVNVNDVIGHEEFKENVRNITYNLDQMTGRANTLLANTDEIMDIMKKASGNVLAVTEQVRDIAVRAGEGMDKAVELVETVRQTVDDTVGRPETVATINRAIDDFGEMATDARAIAKQTRGLVEVLTPEKIDGIVGGVNDLVATGRKALDDVRAKIDAVDADTVNKAIGNVGNASQSIKDILDAINPDDVREMVKKLSGTIGRVAGLADEIMQDPAKALALNKAADRVIEAMFKEMHRQGIRTSEEMVVELRRRWKTEWFGSMLPDPAYPDPEKAPYRRP